MSLESAKAFIERMKTDEDFRNKVNGCKDHKARMLFVKQAGYEFTKDDVELVQSEILEDELEGVAGGNTLCGYYDTIYCQLFYEPS